MTDNQVQIHLLVGIRGLTLLVFYTETDCWQFRFLSLGGAVFGERKIYFTAQAAEQAGREWINKDFED
ncbi:MULTISPECIES: hypothetical protein [Nostocaceae]|jgi:hypothetical protein|uniref:Uncharacterized protein n=6 Tax=Nostocaceae TaxID=1162 RepID=A0A1Z4KS82_ANAVA|nr:MULTISPECIES: hypothetical protein [Nostocaceae]BAY71895.1 hypothetical protein NIES23_47180 [Trichormus variabilis NIES-23]HBW33803.1 hypothetical protein [Nostoc sp. UBA8866]ABA20128.1 conserved hypothetical protein [Trichormus variabilis ATCC 29413]MBC1217448.1 hypothetical protein [Trichormus variabilis ARAD]MBC1257972.1 hypothetical protein [Trichormus variabilis V5]